MIHFGSRATPLLKILSVRLQKVLQGSRLTLASTLGRHCVADIGGHVEWRFSGSGVWRPQGVRRCSQQHLQFGRRLRNRWCGHIVVCGTMRGRTAELPRLLRARPLAANKLRELQSRREEKARPVARVQRSIIKVPSGIEAPQRRAFKR